MPSGFASHRSLVDLIARWQDEAKRQRRRNGAKTDVGGPSEAPQTWLGGSWGTLRERKVHVETLGGRLGVIWDVSGWILGGPGVLPGSSWSTIGTSRAAIGTSRAAFGEGLGAPRRRREAKVGKAGFHRQYGEKAWFSRPQWLRDEVDMASWSLPGQLRATSSDFEQVPPASTVRKGPSGGSHLIPTRATQVTPNRKVMYVPRD